MNELESKMVGNWTLAFETDKRNGTVKFTLIDGELTGVLGESVPWNQEWELTDIHISRHVIAFNIKDWGNFYFVKDINQPSRNIWLSDIDGINDAVLSRHE